MLFDRHNELTEQIIQGFYKVYNTLGYGFSEKVYENALARELAKMGLEVRQQQRLPVYYDGEIVGEYFADTVVNGLVIHDLEHRFCGLNGYRRGIEKISVSSVQSVSKKRRGCDGSGEVA